MTNIVKIEGKSYVRVGDKLVEIDYFDEQGKPVLKCWSEEKPNANGGMDCTVHVSCFQIAAKQLKINKGRE